MTPGIQPMMVSNKFIKKVVPKPCFKKTANGGNKILRIIVSSDIEFDFKLIIQFSAYTLI